MKLTKSISTIINNKPALNKLGLFKKASLPICLVVMSISFISSPAMAENSSPPDVKKGYRYIEYKAPTKATATDSKTENTVNTDEPVSKPSDGKGDLPTFAQADINGDHFVTKDELQNFPYLLQVFDKVDAGGDGKLEQHEYQNLKTETKREGEVR
ncbi:MAG: EF-hand domain-containing protein [Methylobacter sp.]|nr:EF-hand domain-containing protein [Methylobacter sp.]